MRLVCSKNCKEAGVPGAQRESGEREGDEATGAGAPLRENFAFGCKSDGKPLQG